MTVQAAERDRKRQEREERIKKSVRTKWKRAKRKRAKRERAKWERSKRERAKWEERIKKSVRPRMTAGDWRSGRGQRDRGPSGIEGEVGVS